MQTKNGATLVGSLVAITILSITLVAVLNLQASIIRARFFLQHDNTANLLVAEGLEIVRAIHAKGGAVSNGKYQVDYRTESLTEKSTCSESSLTNTCGLDITTGSPGYRISSSTGTKIFYRFVTITRSTDIYTVTSTVIVKSSRGSDKVYKATIKLYTY
jgi:Tfp pilus assembly protein PilV